MKTILISGASSIVGLGILKSLRMSDKKLYLIGTTCFDDTVVPAFCDVFVKAPLTNEHGYISWLMTTIEKYKVDMIIPGIDADMYKWTENIDKVSKGNHHVLINRPELISLCEDKWLFYQKMKASDVTYSIPSSMSNNFEELKAKFGLPLLLKPRCGFGSKGISKVLDKKTFLKHCDKIGEILMVQPFIGDDKEEYTTSAFCDGNGGYFACMTLKRKLSKDGYTEKGEVVEIEGMEEAISEYCKVLKPVGPTNFQFRVANGELRLLEINPRISSATSIRSSFGYNESEMAIDFFLENKKPVQPLIKQGKAVRYVEDYIFYK
ncbi:MAG: ATP-grasp domain-containing protein [Flavobacteriales bacterium]|nr:ATP-grasp domain-containing protein [Flavobacteriales bacterium]